MQFLYLFLAHLTADFLLQPEKMVEEKHKHFRAIAWHAVIHFLIMMVMLFPFWMHINVLIASVALSLVHAVIDYVKVQAENTGKHYVFYFFADQVAHVSLLAMVAVLISDMLILQYSGVFAPLVLYLNGFFVAGLCLAIMATYGYEIAAFQFVRGKKKKFSPDRKRMVKNVIMTGAVYALVVFFGAYKIAAFALSVFLV